MPDLSDAYPEEPHAEFDPAATGDDGWLEVTGHTRPSLDALTLEGGGATLLGSIPWGQARSFARYCLGFAYADPGSPYKLHRENPATHPRFPWLTAASVSFSTFIPRGNDDNPDHEPFVPHLIENDGLRVAKYDRVFAT